MRYLAFAFLFAVALCLEGFGTTEAFTGEDMQCMQQNGLDNLFIWRGYLNIGKIDDTGVANLKTAIELGI